MELSFTQTQDHVRFTLKGMVDESGAEALKTQFASLDKSSLKEVTFDFKEVSHIGSAGIGKLLLFYKDVAINGGIIRITQPSENIYRLLTTLKLDSVFQIDNA